MEQLVSVDKVYNYVIIDCPAGIETGFQKITAAKKL